MLPYIYVFGVTIPMYGLMAVVGFGAAFLLLWFHAKRWGSKRNDVFFAAIYAIIGAVLGAKLLYLIVDFETVIQYPMAFLRGGAVFYGGVIGGVLGGWIYTRIYKISFVEVFDTVAPSIALGHAFGRIGCFCAGCCYGRETDSIFGVVFPEGSSAPSGVSLLPTQLFESAFLLVLAVVLTIVLRRAKRRGFTAGLYLILYGAWRIFIECFRADPRGALLGMSTSQFISIFIIAGGILLIIFGDKIAKRENSRGDWAEEYRAKRQKKQEERGGNGA